MGISWLRINYLGQKTERIRDIAEFDDYGFDTTAGVTKLCEELENQIVDGRCIFHLNGQAIFVKCGCEDDMFDYWRQNMGDAL